MIITGYVPGQPITVEVIGLGIFVEVEQSACIQTLYQTGNAMFDIVYDNVHDIGIRKPISDYNYRYRIKKVDIELDQAISNYVDIDPVRYRNNSIFCKIHVCAQEKCCELT
jgi:hypothetical protein